MAIKHILNTKQLLDKTLLMEIFKKADVFKKAGIFDETLLKKFKATSNCPDILASLIILPTAPLTFDKPKTNRPCA